MLVCNDKYKKKGDFCKTPNLTEEDVKARFINYVPDEIKSKSLIVNEDIKKLIE